MQASQLTPWKLIEARRQSARRQKQLEQAAERELWGVCVLTVCLCVD